MLPKETAVMEKPIPLVALRCSMAQAVVVALQTLGTLDKVDLELADVEGTPAKAGQTGRLIAERVGEVLDDSQGLVH